MDFSSFGGAGGSSGGTSGGGSSTSGVSIGNWGATANNDSVNAFIGAGLIAAALVVVVLILKK